MKFSLRTFSLVLVHISLWMHLSACTIAQGNLTHVLILAIDQFGYESLRCNREFASTQKSGLELLCQDSIRFTHAYTTSQMTRPALASLFTGLPAFLHGVRDNDVQFLRADAITIAEAAERAGYETAFFAGSPVALRNSGLQQGFHFFDDHSISEKVPAFRHFNEAQVSYFNWRNKHHKPTFSVIHVPDLYFKNRLTKTELGEARNYSYESQFEEFDLSLYKMIQQLKSEHLYHRTLIVLVGLNSPEKSKELSTQNLDFNRDQIALLIKPIQKPRDLGISATYDENVSISDIAKSLFDFFKFNEALLPQNPLTNISLFPLKLNSNLQAVRDRWIVSETISPFAIEPRTLSLRKNQFHITQKSQSLKVYNTLIDRLENSPLSKKDPLSQELMRELSDLLQAIEKNSNNSSALLYDDELIPLFESLTTPRAKYPESLLFNTKSKIPDLNTLRERMAGGNKAKFQNLCLQEIESAAGNANEQTEFKNCRSKKIYFLSELLKSQTEPSALQKKKIQVYLSEMRNLVLAARKNKEIGYLQIQPIAEMNRWLPFVVTLHLPAYSKVRNHFMKAENR